LEELVGSGMAVIKMMGDDFDDRADEIDRR
jgi:hypothetical protein